MPLKVSRITPRARRCDMIGCNHARLTMKSQRMLVGFSVLLLTICAVVVPQIWDRVHTLYPTPETESVFLKNYNPKRVIEQFESELPSSYGQHSGGEAG